MYNCDKYLQRCIDSILDNAYSNICLLLIDDGSTDNSAAICDLYPNVDDRVLVIHQDNHGVAYARNVGIEYFLNAESVSFITFIDSDDFVSKEYFEVLLRGLHEKSVDIAACMFQYYKDGDPTKTDCNNDFCLVTPEMIMCDYAGISAVSWGKLYKKELFEDIRFPNEAKISEDSATTYKVLFKRSHIALTESQMYFYYVNESSVTRNCWSTDHLYGRTALTEQIAFFSKNGYERAYKYKLYIYIVYLRKTIRQLDNYPELETIQSDYVREFRECSQKYCEITDTRYCQLLVDYLSFSKCSIEEKLLYLLYLSYRKIKKAAKRIVNRK